MAKLVNRKIPLLGRVAAWIPAISWMCFIFFLSSRSRISASESFWLNFAIFKTLHVIEYATLALLNLFALVINNPNKSIRSLALKAAILALIYGMSDEYHQTFVPTREGTIRDVLIDSIGIFSVYSLAVIYEKNKKFFTSRLRSWKTQ